MEDFKRLEVRTDLAVEEKESFPGDGGEIRGVSLKEWRHEETGVKLTEVVILDDKGAKAMGKPMGTYLTLEAPMLSEKDEDYHREVSGELATQIKKLIGQMVPRHSMKRSVPSILVVGLGNTFVTPDSLGPKVIDNLNMTRHLVEAYGEAFCEKNKLPMLSGIVPGVMAQTGMESAEIVKGIVDQTKPDLVIAIDALAARSVHRLGCTIQISNTGIQPGSGVGNHRSSLTLESLGVPVLAIGVPTVVGAAAIVCDTVTAMVQTLEQNDSTKPFGTYVASLNEDEQYQLIRELLEPQLGPMFVTPHNIDETVKTLSFTISEGLHQTFTVSQGKKTASLT